jgi:hypothetical protein
MTVQTPPFLGLILRKNERTRRFIEQQIEYLLKRSAEARDHLDQDEHLIAFSVAMNGMVLDETIEELVEQGAVYGTDFVATGSHEGVLGDVPPWLSEKTVRQVFEPMKLTQLTKVYTFVPTGEAAERRGDP